MVVDLTHRTKAVIVHLFGSERASSINELLMNECGVNLPFFADATSEVLERVQLAVLKLSGGGESELIASVLDAQRDWRDVLVWAGFGSDLEAHIGWAEALNPFVEPRGASRG